MIDSAGNFAYEGRHRKPKWVQPQELERFRRHEDRSLGHGNSRNSRIRIEDPFLRRPDANTIFDHISAPEISKYVIGSSYLEKSQLDHEARMETAPRLLDHSLLYDELLRGHREPLLVLTTGLLDDAVAQMKAEF